MSKNHKNTVDVKIYKLRSNYVQKLPDKILKLEQYVELIKRGKNFEKNIKDLRSILHTFSGTAGTYGFEDLGNLAKKVLSSISSILSDKIEYTTELSFQIESLILKVGDKILDIYDSYEVDVNNYLEQGILKSDLDYGKILFISKKESINNNKFSNFIINYKLKIDYVDIEIEKVISYFQKNLPVSVFVNMDDVLENFNLFSKINDLKESYLQVIDFIFISEKSDINTRLSAIKRGADFFFSYPNEESNIKEYIDYNILYSDNRDPKILIVSDDLSKSNGYATMLSSASMEILVVENPLGISKHLIEFSPDIILMEMYMDCCSGIDLSKIIQQQSAYSNLPIVFTSSKGGKDKQLLAIENGGDDYFEEPIDPGYLIQLLSIRAERVKKIKSKMDKDGLTRLYNQRKTKELLEIEFLRSKRYGKNFVFAMLDIDWFKKVNDTYGHLTGDSVLRNFSSILSNRFRKTDIVGRYGGEEFVVILMETSLYFAEIVFNKLREEFERFEHVSGDDIFNVTFSCGLASADEFDSSLDINAAADKALYKAKNDGRNRVAVFHRDLEE